MKSFYFYFLNVSFLLHITFSKDLNLHTFNPTLITQEPKTTSNSVLVKNARFLDHGNMGFSMNRKYINFNSFWGIMIFIVSFPILWFNERRLFEADCFIKEVSETCKEINSEEYSEENDGRLVFLSGECKNIDLIIDSELGAILPNGLSLLRKVECYQYIEVKSQRKKSLESITALYHKEWSEKFHDSNDFIEKREFINPSELEWPVKSKSFLSDSTFLGKFLLNFGQIEKIDKMTYFEIKKNELIENNFEKFKTYYKVSVKDNFIYLKQSQNGDEIGDFRVSYQYTPCQSVSLIAMQSGNGFGPYFINKNTNYQKQKYIEKSAKCFEFFLSLLCLCSPINCSPDHINWICAGKLTKKQFFLKELPKKTNNTYLIRIIGIFCMSFGIFLFLSPLNELGQEFTFIVFDGKCMGLILTLMISIPLSLIIIIIAWILYKPIWIFFVFITLVIVMPLIGFFLITKSMGKGF